MIIQNRDRELTTYNVISQSFTKKNDHEYVVSVLVSDATNPNTSILYVRGPVDSIKPLLKKSEASDVQLNFLLSQYKRTPGYRFMYARKELNSSETSKAKND